jgi:hypothetical protein
VYSLSYSEDKIAKFGTNWIKDKKIEKSDPTGLEI